MGPGFRIAGFGVLGFAACIAAAQNPEPKEPATSVRFIFQNNFWVNLHHVLDGEAHPEYRHDMALEMLFHEVSHADGISRPVIAAIRAAADRQHVAPPRDLPHVIIFYTAGELARRTLGRAGDAHYLPYAYRYDVYSSQAWQPLRDAVVRDWHPRLDGTVSFADAIDALVRDLRR